jgi:hypothetical protein
MGSVYVLLSLGSGMPQVERALRDKAREKLRDATLPLMKPNRIWGGPGAGFNCAVCDLHITKDQTELEVQFVREGMTARAVFHFHPACFSAWELERRLLVRASATR